MRPFSVRAVFFAIVAYYLPIALAWATIRPFVASHNQPGIVADAGTVLLGSVGALLLTLVFAPGRSGFLLARLAGRRVVRNFAIILLAVTSIDGVAALLYMPGPIDVRFDLLIAVLGTSIALVFAAMGAWLGSHRQARLDDQELMVSLRSS